MYTRLPSAGSRETAPRLAGAGPSAPPAGNPHPGLTPSTLHRAPVGQEPSGPDWLAISFGFWSGRVLATGTAWAGLCLIHHHHRPGFPFGVLGAGGRLPKARRGRVFIAQSTIIIIISFLAPGSLARRSPARAIHHHNNETARAGVVGTKGKMGLCALSALEKRACGLAAGGRPRATGPLIGSDWPPCMAIPL